MLEIRSHLVRKGPIVIVDIQDIVPHKIIADIDIGPAVPVDIRNRRVMPVSFYRDPRFFGYIMEYRMLQRIVPVVPVKTPGTTKAAVRDDRPEICRIGMR